MDKSDSLENCDIYTWRMCKESACDSASMPLTNGSSLPFLLPFSSLPPSLLLAFIFWVRIRLQKTGKPESQGAALLTVG